MTAHRYSETAVRRPSWRRLTTVELRKMVDTRAGVWIVATIGLLSLAVIPLWLAVLSARQMTFAELFPRVLYEPVGLLVPVIGILAVTSEWGHRTALTTFTLVPQRHRIATAKIRAALLLALSAVTVSILIGASGTLLGAILRDGDGGWRVPAPLIGDAALFMSIRVLTGVALGMLLMNSALAIVVYFLMPIMGFLAALSPVGTWLDLADTTSLLAHGQLTGTHWWHLGTSVTAWVLLPLTAGLIRLSRREVQ
jgi:ABC-2 type transport system permease protein